MITNNEQLKQILLDQNFITEEDIKGLEADMEQSGSLYTKVIEEGLLTPDLVGQAVAEQAGLVYADLNSIVPPKELVQSIPEDIATKSRVIPFQKKESTLVLTSDNIEIWNDEELKSRLAAAFPNTKITHAFSLADDINTQLLHFRKSLSTRFSQIIESNERIAPTILDEVFADAISFRASDIHLEPTPDHLLVRFRVDGVMYEAGRIPKQHYESIVNRIKVQANLRIDEHQTAQDGALRFQANNTYADMRISIVPTLEGEKVVIRVLAEYVHDFSFESIGLTSEYASMVRKEAFQPYGMILVVGPTGSGKTTTLYSLLKLLHRPEINITTIEDPVEYRIAGVNQIKVNEATGLSFAKGLRSIVRQDPDVILVGEIRDRETAEIAINAALTGHLVLSTFHSNDAATAIPRLINMGIEPFLLASTLNIIIGQRLVRKIGEECRQSIEVKVADLEQDYPRLGEFVDHKESLTLYSTAGCPDDSKEGYRGRVGIFEAIQTNTRAMKDLIVKRPTSQEVWRLANEQGSRPLFFDGIKKVLQGVTTLEEVYRIAQPPSN